jgi:hypothetical protein
VDGLTDVKDIAHWLPAKFRDLNTNVPHNKYEMQSIVDDLNVSVISDCMIGYSATQSARPTETWEAGLTATLASRLIISFTPSRSFLLIFLVYLRQYLYKALSLMELRPFGTGKTKLSPYG